MLDKIKLLLGVEDTKKDPRINLLIEEAKAYLIGYCNLEGYNVKYDSLIISMVLEDYRKLGNEGLSSTGAEGLNNAFINGYSDKVIKQLRKYKKARFI